ncbi:MAG: AAA family ATPase [Desulfitobacterium hafniense]|nr:AAA family ATPase [Desulfitobacterium hafniense]
MYISKISIEGFRNFKKTEVQFNDGINVIIGHNNSGKTNLLKALSLIFDSSFGTSKSLGVDDFYKNIELQTIKEFPPLIRISLFMNESNDENLFGDDLATVSNWITKLENPYEARLTYEFFLPEKERGLYFKSIGEINDVEEGWRIIKRDFIRKYNYKIYGGEPKFQNQAERENLQKFDLQFLDAIRDVERDMFTGRSTLLKEVLHFFMDYQIKKNTDMSLEQQTEEIRNKQKEFSHKARPLLEELLERISEGQKEILDYAIKTGASFNQATPNFDGDISEIDLLSSLRLIIEEQIGIKVPATHNGLGYNNLIFMSLLLAKMQANADGDYYGSNAKVFPILVIEEPEAHLHPSMQYKFLKFLKENKEKKVRQVFVTTHSTHITSAVSLDDIICLHKVNDNYNVGYPGKVFGEDEPEKKSKAYVQRFLDATKSNMLFAQKVILVEGLAEQILMKIVTKHVDAEKDLEDHHIEVISIGGRYFDHFLKLFDSTKPNTIHKKIVCITDRDPERKEHSGDTFMKCYPFEYNLDTTRFEYKENASGKLSIYNTHPNIRFFSQNEEKGKTLEYDLAFYNPTLDFLLTESISNKNELTNLMKAYKEGKALGDFILRTSEENTRIKDSLALCTWIEDDKKKAMIASRYLNSVGKGENALELSNSLDEDFISGNLKFIVPDYLREAIEWLFQ